MSLDPAALRSAAGARGRVAAGLVYRAAVGLAGACLILLGLVLVPLPGPGWPVVFLGFVVLSTEFEWADRVRRVAQDHVARATRRPASAAWPVRAVLRAAAVASLIVPALVMAGRL